MRNVLAVALGGAILLACGSTGGGTAGAGGAGATGGAGGSGGAACCSIRGVVSVPAGQLVGGVQILACFPNAAGTDCDADRSKAIQLTGGAASAPFEIGGLESGTYFMWGAKDNNGNDMLDAGDLAGAVSKDGTLEPLKPPVDGIALSLVVVPTPTTNVPASLVGSWKDTYNGQLLYEIHADGTYVKAGEVDYSPCEFFQREQFSESGTISLSGNQITFAPRTGQITQWDCEGLPHDVPSRTDPTTFTYRQPDASTLVLTGEFGDTTFAKQP